MFEQKVEAGHFIINQNDDGDFFYVVETGRYSALQTQGEDSQTKTVFTYDNKGNFGELALLYNMPRAASVRVSPDGVRTNRSSDILQFIPGGN